MRTTFRAYLFPRAWPSLWSDGIRCRVAASRCNLISAYVRCDATGERSVNRSTICSS